MRSYEVIEEHSLCVFMCFVCADVQKDIIISRGKSRAVIGRHSLCALCARALIKDKMRTENELRENLRAIDGAGYKAYKGLKGEYDFGDYTLYIDSVQADPFASPSRLRVRMYKDKAGFPDDTYSNRSREIALRDFITRKFHESAHRYTLGDRGRVRPHQRVP